MKAVIGAMPSRKWDSQTKQVRVRSCLCIVMVFLVLSVDMQSCHVLSHLKMSKHAVFSCPAMLKYVNSCDILINIVLWWSVIYYVSPVLLYIATTVLSNIIWSYLVTSLSCFKLPLLYCQQVHHHCENYFIWSLHIPFLAPSKGPELVGWDRDSNWNQTATRKICIYWKVSVNCGNYFPFTFLLYHPWKTRLSTHMLAF